MFHTYVTTACGTTVDLDRAMFIADRDLADDVLEAAKERHASFKWDDFDIKTAARMGCNLTQPTLADVFWAAYCQAHLETYGEPFRPNVDPRWGG